MSTSREEEYGMIGICTNYTIYENMLYQSQFRAIWENQPLDASLSKTLSMNPSANA